MARISLFISLLLIGEQCLFAQSSTTYPTITHQIPVIELELSDISVFNAYRINSDGYDFSPSYYQDGIVYVSAQESNTSKKRDTPFFELFHAIIGEDGMPSQPTPFSTQVNTQRHEGQASFNETEDLIYYTSNSDFKNAKGQYSMKIYEARKGATDWQHIVDLPFNSEAYSNRHPSISSDGNRLYFASNMPGGYGGTDIYVVEKEGAYWGIPKNLGDQINTSENDAFPFIYKDEYLFFSSKGHGGLGDYDIFAVNIEDGLPGPILHIPTPINSQEADIGFIMNAASTNGFFASDRKEGSGKDDIYLFESPTGFFPKKIPVPTKKVEKIRKEEVIAKPAAKTATATSNKISTPAKKTNIKPKSVNKTNPPPTTVRPSKSTPISAPPNACTTLNGLLTNARNNQALANKVLSIRSSCGGQPLQLKTDYKGMFEACLPFNCQYIIAITTEGFSPKDLLFKVTEDQELKKELTLEPLPNNPPAIPATQYNNQLKTGSTIELQAIYYDLKNGKIRPSDLVELDAVAQMMQQFSSVSIELLEHTDARGTAYYNQQLSQTRADIAKNYLVQQKGIASSRIQAIGVGEKQLRNHCREEVSCTDQEHQYNRRTEIRIVKMATGEKVWFGK